MRRSIVARLHQVEAEPQYADYATIQLRRRVFWSTYDLDRLACGVLHIPFSIADDNITVPVCIDKFQPRFTNESSSLMISTKQPFWTSLTSLDSQRGELKSRQPFTEHD